MKEETDSTENGPIIDTDLLKQCWFLAGPTASGKSATALRLAARDLLDAEIVSLDSMAIYREMDIGTAKPSLAERSQVRHHMIDIVDPHEEFSVAQYCEQALVVCREIVDRGRAPLFVGGTGLYLRSLLRGVFEGPPADWEFRRELEAQARESSNEGYLLDLLNANDPETAARLHANDHRRIIRALEVQYVTGKPMSQLQLQKPLPVEQRPRHVYWLEPPRDWLYDRINRRVDLMMDQGLLEEVDRLLDREAGLSHTAKQALGYKELITHLRNQAPLPECVEAIKTRTRQFAKRQHTWFRNLEEATAIPVSGEESAEELAAGLLRRK